MNSTTLYWEEHKLFEDQLLEDGFYDPGRVVLNLRTGIPPTLTILAPSHACMRIDPEGEEGYGSVCEEAPGFRLGSRSPCSDDGSLACSQ